MPIRERRAIAWRPVPVPNASKRADGNDAGRTRLESMHAERIAAAFRVVLRAIMPARVTRAMLTPDAAAQRLSASFGVVGDAVAALLLDAVTLGAEDAFVASGGVVPNVDAELRASWATVHSYAVDWLWGGGTSHFGNGYASTLIAGILDHSQDIVRHEIVAWTVAGEPMPALTTRLESVALSRTRAELIAVTETTRAYAEGSRLAWEHGGIIRRMRWQTANDDLVCPICMPLNGMVAPVDGSGKFEGYDDNGISLSSADMPPAHARCRCWLSPVVDD